MVSTENLKRQNQTSRIFFALFWDAKEYLRRPFFFCALGWVLPARAPGK